MKKFVGFVYGSLFSYMLLENLSKYAFIITIIWGILSLIWGIKIVALKIWQLLNISSYVNLKRRRELLKEVKFINLSLIPFFIINFAYWFTGFMAALRWTREWMIFLIAIGLTYMVVVVTASCGVVVIVAYNRAGILNVKNVAVHIIFQFIFVINVIDIIFLIKKFEKKDRLIAELL